MPAPPHRAPPARSLSPQQVPSLLHGGLSWFADLTVPDPYYGLPLACAAVTLAMLEGVLLRDPTNPLSQKKGLAMVLRGASLLIVPLGGTVPAAVGLLWLSNSLYGIVQGTALRSARGGEGRVRCGVVPFGGQREGVRACAT